MSDLTPIDTINGIHLKRDILPLLQKIVSNNDDVYVTKKFRARTHRGVQLYTAQTMISVQVGQIVATTYAAAGHSQSL